MKYTVAKLIEKLQEFPGHYAVIAMPVFDADTNEIIVKADESDSSILLIGVTPFNTQPATQQE